MPEALGLKQTVGRSGAVDPGDVLNIKKILKRLGLYEIPDDGLTPDTDEAMFKAIKGFQDSVGLAADGVAAPDGPTVRDLNHALRLRRGPPDATATGSRGGARVAVRRPDALRRGTRLTADLEEGGGARVAVRRRGALRRGTRLTADLEEGGGAKVAVRRRGALRRSTRLTAGLGDRDGAGAAEPRRRILSGEDRDGGNGAGSTAPAGTAGPRRPMLEHFMDRVERTYRGYVKAGRKKGLNMAAGFLERFLDGTAGTVRIPRADARALKPVGDAEKTNRGRIERSFTDTDHRYGDALDDIQDGQTLTLTKDHWDRKLTVPGLILRGETDLALATGNSNVKSEGSYKATLKGDVIHIEGEVTHTWNDKYDFHKWQPYADGARALQKHRGARPFYIRSGWKQRLTGTIILDHRRLTAPRFRWADRN